jgi:predicted N-acetyltransferase YhbS
MSELVVRGATAADQPGLQALIERSFRALGGRFYPPDVVEAALGNAIRLDVALVREGTYFVAEESGELVGCGGWSARHATVPGAALPEGHAEVRAMFVAPARAGRGIGQALLAASERAIAGAGFAEAHLVATLSGVDFYLRAGYRRLQESAIALPGGLSLAVLSMVKTL